MAIIKCKMCGGDLIITEGSTVCECEYCGTMQTIPCMDDEKKLVLFERAERLRKACEFDKAAGVYEAIVADYRQEAEAYWGLVLCKYGVEYVDDPVSKKKVPTCHRSSFDSIMEDSDFDMTLENADAVARKVYREEAKQLEEIRKGIVEVSSKEDPYDIFICYKETDEKGERTLDSVLAQDIYTMFTEKGYRVFFSRITLEDKLGQEYEPYIFAALNSAKVMLAVGTDYEYYNAVWVKNEWSRYLKLIASGKQKTLIPCYKNIDAYDMPKEFAKLQAQDLGKVGAMQDLLRGVEKILDTAPAVKVTSGVQEADLNKSYIYNNALEKAQKNDIKSLKTAIKNLESISGWMDADTKIEELKKQLEKLKKIRNIIRGVVGVICLIIGIFMYDETAERQAKTFEEQYATALSYYENGEYDTAEHWMGYAKRKAFFAGKVAEANQLDNLIKEKLKAQKELNAQGLEIISAMCEENGTTGIGFVKGYPSQTDGIVFVIYIKDGKMYWLTTGEENDQNVVTYEGENTWKCWKERGDKTKDCYFTVEFVSGKMIVDAYDGSVSTGTYYTGQQGYDMLVKHVKYSNSIYQTKGDYEAFLKYLGHDYVEAWSIEWLNNGR